MNINIQWYPGHMEKARREVEQNLKLVDVIIELLDARAPLSSRNPVIEKIIKDKPRLVVLNKSDLADREATKQWMEKLKKDGIVLATDAQRGKGINKVAPLIEKLTADKLKRRPVRCMVIGIPNVGKSMFINVLVKKKVAQTGSKPGVTRGQKWIRINKKVQLLDTPGILWPKFEEPEVAFKLAVIGSVKEEVFNVEDVAFELVKWLEANDSGEWKKRYNIERGLSPGELLEEIGKSRGFIQSGGRVDVHKAAVHLLKEFREAKLGLFTLDMP